MLKKFVQDALQKGADALNKSNDVVDSTTVERQPKPNKAKENLQKFGNDAKANLEKAGNVLKGVGKTIQENASKVIDELEAKGKEDTTPEE